VPFLVHGDTAWSLLVNLTLAEAEEYLDDCQAKGFNAVIANLIEHSFTINTAPQNANGDAPFTGTAFQSATVTAYFDHVLAVVQAAAARGIVVFLEPCYLGFEGGSEGWHAEIEAASAGQAEAWGAFVGALLADEPNIVYVMFGDYEPASAARTASIVAGIQGADSSHTLYGAHYGSPSHSGHDAINAWDTWDFCYKKVDGYMHHEALDGYAADFGPCIMGEAQYENNPTDPADQEQLRRQAWGFLLSGGIGGHFYGNAKIWGFGNSVHFDGNDWADSANDPGRLSMAHVLAFFAAIPWHTLVPDTSSALVTAGRGTLLSAAYVTAAKSADSTVAAIYAPGSITVDLTQMAGSGAVTARWYDPTDGSFTAATGSPIAQGSHAFVASSEVGNNSGGDPDWVLLLET
jgi:hypothetical protein